MGHRLPSYDGICASPHGHNIRVEVEVNVEDYPFLDFKILDNALHTAVESMDHAMVLFEGDPLLKTCHEMGFRTYAVKQEPTTEFLAWHIGNKIYASYNLIRCTVFETDKYSATWRPD